MTTFHVFNGDADGICSMVQLYRAQPESDAVIVTSANDKVTTLDISMRSNNLALVRILESGAHVFYADHHNAGDIPKHENLEAHIDTSAETCTAVIVDDYLNGQYRAWAITAAFGDNFPKVAKAKAEGLDLPLEQLERLGILLNYNGYGSSVDDLHFHPAELYIVLREFDTPMNFLAERPEIFAQLDDGYKDDMQAAENAKVLKESSVGVILELPDTASSRRVSGVYGNQLAKQFPQRAHAILTRKTDDAYVVSVRAPLNNRVDADTLCLQFETGGGRSAAAGINHLPASELETFMRAFEETYA